ncbi:unnamed protein product [Closterium sp. NIES-54]
MSFSSANSLSPPLKIKTAPLSLSRSRGRINPTVASTGNGASASRAAKLVEGRVQEGPDLSVEVNGLRLPNPFVIASGPPGTNYVVMKKAFDEGWGGVICKTATSNSRVRHHASVLNVASPHVKLGAVSSRSLSARFPVSPCPLVPSSPCSHVLIYLRFPRFPHSLHPSFPLSPSPSSRCAALPGFIQGGQRHAALREAARACLARRDRVAEHRADQRPAVRSDAGGAQAAQGGVPLTCCRSPHPPFPVSSPVPLLSPPSPLAPLFPPLPLQLSLDSSKVVNVTPRYAKLRAPHSRDVIGWQNIELISDRPFEVMLAELKQLKAEYPHRVLIASIMEEFNRDAWEEIIGRCEEVGVVSADVDWRNWTGMH